jgi:AraC-like DNA-binding protein
MSDSEARIPQDRFDRIWLAASDLTGDPCIGLHAGGRVVARAVNIVGYLLLSSATLEEGLRRVAHYQRALTGAEWIAIEDGERWVEIRVGMAHGDEDVRAIHAEYVAPLVLRLMSWVTGSEVRPSEAHFRHDPRGDREEYVRVLGCPVKFACDRSELIMAAGVLEQPSLHADARVAELHDEFAMRLLAEAGQGNESARATHALAGLLEHGPCDLKAVARRLHISPRTLQRRLADEGSSFRAVFDMLRRELALEHLRRRNTPITEIAYLTGFSELSAFTRAVRRWFDQTPSELRHRAS